jgi:plastocyanin
MTSRPISPLILFALLPLSFSHSGLEAQDLLSRTPNLSGGWVGERGAIQTSFNHRFWFIETPDERKIMNSPSFLVGIPLPGRIMATAIYASNSRVASGKFNEWESHLRWRPREALGPIGLSLTGGYNFAAKSLDGELSLSTSLPLPGGFPGDSLTILAAGRVFSDAFGMGANGWFGGGGAILHFGNGIAFTGDFGQATMEETELRVTWGAGIHFRIPASPHSVALYATNAQTGTLQGSSVGGRTVWGFEFTVPLTIARFFPGSGGTALGAQPATGGLEVTMTDNLRYLPEVLQVRVGDTVVWRNTSNLVHTVTADPARVRDPAMVSLPAGAAPFDSGSMQEGDIFRHTFTVPGTYTYLCAPHDRMGMVGRIVVMP